MEYASRQVDRYVGANGVLKNLVAASDEETLAKLESELVFLRHAELMERPMGECATLREIHRHLFQDVYAWAGQYRTINMQKDTEMFCHHPLIEENVERIMLGLAAEKELAGLGPEAFSERAAYYLGEINMVHPFREGNGRTQRAFLSRIAQRAGYLLAWKNVTQSEMIRASVVSARTADNSLFAGIILRELGFAPGQVPDI